MDNLCNCKACRRNLTATVNRLAQSKSVREIITSLRFDYGVDLSELALREHFQHFSITPIESSEVVVERSQPINLSELTLDRWNLSIENPAKIVGFIQEKLIALSLRQMQIVAQEQEEFIQGNTVIPPNKDQINNLRTLLNLTDRFSSISLESNQQRAIQIVQRLGYGEEGLIDRPRLEGDRPS